MALPISADIEIEGYLKFLNSYLDLFQHEIRNGIFQNLSAAPASPVTGQFYFDTVKLDFGVYTGAAWLYSQDVTKLNGQVASWYLSRANHTGTQLASTISNFDTQVRTSRLDQMAAPTAAVSMNSQQITNLVDPTAAQHAATKNYVDTSIASVISGTKFKDLAKVATTANITLSGTQTIDGIAVVAGDRVLVWKQTTTSANGIYIVSASTWTRASDADTWIKLVGACLWVEKGTLYADKQFQCTSDTGGTLGTTAVTFVNVPNANDIIGGNGLTKTGNQLDVNVDNTTIKISGDQIVLADAYQSLAPQNSVITGDGTTTNFAVTHALGVQYVNVAVIAVATNTPVIVPWTCTSATVVTINFKIAPANGVQYLVRTWG